LGNSDDRADRGAISAKDATFAIDRPGGNEITAHRGFSDEEAVGRAGVGAEVASNAAKKADSGVDEDVVATRLAADGSLALDISKNFKNTEMIRNAEEMVLRLVWEMR